MYNWIPNAYLQASLQVWPTKASCTQQSRENMYKTRSAAFFKIQGSGSKQIENLTQNALNLGSVNFFAEGPDSKYFHSQLLNPTTAMQKQPLTICKQMGTALFYSNFIYKKQVAQRPQLANSWLKTTSISILQNRVWGRKIPSWLIQLFNLAVRSRFPHLTNTNWAFLVNTRWLPYLQDTHARMAMPSTQRNDSCPVSLCRIKKPELEAILRTERNPRPPLWITAPAH